MTFLLRQGMEKSGRRDGESGTLFCLRPAWCALYLKNIPVDRSGYLNTQRDGRRFLVILSVYHLALICEAWIDSCRDRIQTASLHAGSAFPEAFYNRLSIRCSLRRRPLAVFMMREADGRSFRYGGNRMVCLGAVLLGWRPQP